MTNGNRRGIPFPTASPGLRDAEVLAMLEEAQHHGKWWVAVLREDGSQIYCHQKTREFGWASMLPGIEALLKGRLQARELSGVDMPDIYRDELSALLAHVQQLLMSRPPIQQTEADFRNFLGTSGSQPLEADQDIEEDIPDE